MARFSPARQAVSTGFWRPAAAAGQDWWRYDPTVARWVVYFLLSVALVGLLAILLGVASHLYWGASPRPGGDYYLFGRELPAPLGAMLWASIKPLLVLTPAAAAWAAYRCVRAKRAERSAGQCTACGYDLTGNVSGVCPECGTHAERPDDGS